jgi:hypothetical protein
MALTKREKNRRLFSAMLKERGLTQPATAELLYVSLDTVKSWLKPETSTSGYPVPQWAIELLGFKVPIKPGKPGPEDIAYQRKRVAAHKARKAAAR